MGYAVADGCVRELIERLDSYRLLCFKETLSGIIIGSFGIPLMIYGWRRQYRTTGSGGYAAGRLIGWTLVGAFFCQVPGNFSLLWAYRQVGMAVAGAISLGTTILFAAVLGRVFLKERVSLPTLLGMAVLITSVVLLSVAHSDVESFTSATATQKTERLPSLSEGAAVSTEVNIVHEATLANGGGISVGTVSLWRGILGCVMAILCGLSCAILATVIRYVGNQGAPVWLPAFVVPILGLPATLPVILWQQGFTWAVFDISAADYYGVLTVSALCNVVAFVSLCKGIQLTSVVFGNVSGTIRLALVSLVGIFWFHEPGGFLMGTGVVLACLGTVLIGAAPHYGTETFVKTEEIPSDQCGA